MMSPTEALEAELYLRRDMKEPDRFQFPGGEVVVYSCRSPGKTSDNEDAAVVVSTGEAGEILVVADGLGGSAAGEEASRLAVSAVRDAAKQALNSGVDLRTAILNAIESANQKILDLGIGAATTIAALEIQNGVIRPYHVGDSSILVVGQRGKIKLLTVAHAPVSQAVDAGMMDHLEALHHEDRHLVSNVLGTAEMRIEIGPSLRLARFDTALLATDGLFDNLTTEDIVERIRKGPLLRSIKKLIEIVHARMNDSQEGVPGKPDDLTLIAFRLRRQ